MHSGHDLYAPVGTETRSVMAGKVVAIGNDVNGYGRYVTVEHNVLSSGDIAESEIFESGPEGQKYYSFYAHLSQVDVENGQELEVGQQIGLTGVTGNASDESGEQHLHFELGLGLRSNGRTLDRSQTLRSEYSLEWDIFYEC